MPETVLAYAIVDLARAKTYGQFTTVDAVRDEMLSQCINYVTGQIESECGRNLMSRTYASTTALIHDGTGCSSLRCKEWPVTTLAAARYRTRDGAGGTTAIDISGYEVHYGRKLYLPRSVFPCGEGNIEIDCTAGYLAGTHDSKLKALQLAALRWIQVMYQDYKNGVGRSIGFSAGGDSVTLVDVAMPKDVKQALAPFVRYD